MGDLANSIGLGFSLMDNYYDRQERRAARKENERMNRRLMDMREQRHKQDIESGSIQQEAAKLTLDKAKNIDYAQRYAYITTDENGELLDPSKLTRDQFRQKKGELEAFYNDFPAARKLFTQNPNVNPDKPLAGIQFMYDKQSGSPVAMFELNMKDGSKAMLSENRSSDQSDPYVGVPLDQLHQMTMGALGQYMGLKPTPDELRANKAAMARDNMNYRRELDKENRKFNRDLTLEKLKQSNKQINQNKNKVTKVTDEYGAESFVRYDPQTDQMIPISIAGSGAQENNPLTLEELDRARIELNTADGKDRGNDWIPFNEPSEDLIRKRAYENRGVLKESPTQEAEQSNTGSQEDPLLALLKANRAKSKPTPSTGGRAESMDEAPPRASQSRKQRREDRSSAHATANNEYVNNVPNMSDEELSKWFESNSKYLSLKKQEMIRRKLKQAKKSGRNQ